MRPQFLKTHALIRMEVSVESLTYSEKFIFQTRLYVVGIPFPLSIKPIAPCHAL